MSWNKMRARQQQIFATKVSRACPAMAKIQAILLSSRTGWRHLPSALQARTDETIRDAKRRISTTDVKYFGDRELRMRARAQSGQPWSAAQGQHQALLQGQEIS
jgi:hypothetical protein